MMQELRLEEIMAVNGGSTPRQDDRQIFTEREGRILGLTIIGAGLGAWNAGPHPVQKLIGAFKGAVGGYIGGQMSTGH